LPLSRLPPLSRFLTLSTAQELAMKRFWIAPQGERHVAMPPNPVCEPSPWLPELPGKSFR
jgi:hypothetical protein